MDRAEFDRILERHYRDNFELLAKKYGNAMGSRDKAEDCLQEAYTRALTYSKIYNQSEPFDPWFKIIFHNCIKDRFRSDIMAGMDDLDIEDVDIPVNPAGIPSVVLEQIRGRMESKQPHLAKILSLYLFEQLRPKDIAKVVPENANYIRQIIFKFREEIKEDYQWQL